MGVGAGNLPKRNRIVHDKISKNRKKLCSVRQATKIPFSGEEPLVLQTPPPPCLPFFVPTIYRSWQGKYQTLILIKELTMNCCKLSKKIEPLFFLIDKPAKGKSYRVYSEYTGSSKNRGAKNTPAPHFEAIHSKKNLQVKRFLHLCTNYSKIEPLSI